jgi:DNA-binding NarL/FixJ family response regulator
MSTSKPRILIADDHRMLADAFERILAPDYEIVGTVADGRELVEVAPALAPDAIVLDVSMPRLNGLDAARQLKQLVPNAALVIITMHSDPKVAADAREAGVLGFVTKSAAASELRTALAAALEGRPYLTPLVPADRVEALLKRAKSRGRSRLTPRQRQVLQLLAEGMSMKQIGYELDLSTRTIQHHKYKIMEEQGIDSNAGLLQLAIEEHLIDAPPS